ncbi:MAG: ferrous iron transport protein B [Clostridiales bacterium]|nr:ferrous iron transport protein B [Clostridiales bacterium]
MSTIALLGQPNSGKSTVFNQLTGARQHVGNWPGKTVEKKDGSFSYNGKKYELIDLPGSYALSGNSDEEIITEDFIKSGKADLVCILVDASQLERSMYMVSEFALLDKPAVLLLNMMDVAKKQNKEIDDKLLSERLGIPVLPFTAADGKEYGKLKDMLEQELSAPHKLVSKPWVVDSGKEKSIDLVKAESEAKFQWVAEMLDGVTKTKTEKYELSKFDRVAIRPVLGKLVSIGIILLAFLVAMIVCIPFMSLGSMIPKYSSGPISDALTSINVHPWLVSIFSLMIPNVIYFSLSMAAFVLGVNLVFGFLEEVGFLARAAYQFDGVLSKIGLQGKAVAPLLMGFGCTIGGSCGTRVMDNWGQKMLAMAAVWAIPCASIWSIIPVVSGMFFPAWGTLLICLCILLYVVFMMFIVSKVFGKKLAPIETRTGMIMELPPYHKAHWKHIWKEAFFKALDIFLRALRTVTIISLLFWALSYSGSGAIEDSILYKIGTAIEPVTKFFGMGWRTFMAFLSGAFAKEAVLGVLNAVFVGDNSLLNATFNAKTAGADAGSLSTIMSNSVSQAEALAFMFAVTFNIPCVMALSTTYRESHSLKWTARVAIFYFGSALLLSCVVYHVASLFL